MLNFEVCLQYFIFRVQDFISSKLCGLHIFENFIYKRTNRTNREYLKNSRNY
jgi:hypothetical protein